jgi:nucleoside-diphosphate-sugar epimerase
VELVIIHSTLAYGPNVRGNFASVINAFKKGITLPFGGINNKRSLVALDNLVDLIICRIDYPAAANQVFFVADRQDLSTTALFRVVARAASVSSYLVSIPCSLLVFSASILATKAVVQRLLGSLQVNIGKARDLLYWSPPVTIDDGIHRCFDDRNWRQ